MIFNIAHEQSQKNLHLTLGLPNNRNDEITKPSESPNSSSNCLLTENKTKLKFRCIMRGPLMIHIQLKLTNAIRCGLNCGQSKSSTRLDFSPILIIK